MEKKQKNTDAYYIKALESTSRFTENAVRQAIKDLNLFDGSIIMDMPCGIGIHISWMLEENKNVFVTGVDINEKIIDYARKKISESSSEKSWELLIEDINELSIRDDVYDFVWCCDGLWAGPKEIGCISEEPYSILKSMKRITKKGGTIAVLFWSGQKLLSGYPLLEAALNSTAAANKPYNTETDPELHYMRTSFWMEKTGLKNIRARTYSASIQSPFNEQDRNGMAIIFNMLWGQAEPEVSDNVWKKFKIITNPDSPEYILGQEGYVGYVNYTMFTGEVIK